MGFDIQGTRLVLLARRQGVDFTRAVTLGRQWLGVDAPDLNALIQEIRVELDAEQRQAISAGLPYADGLLRALGAKVVESLDASAYEGASILHDLNEELPRALIGQFTLVIDCGTLEHVFNFPVAIRNCMRLLQVGGHLLLATPTNNFMGHGFYQFQPGAVLSSAVTRERFQSAKDVRLGTATQRFLVRAPRSGIAGRQGRAGQCSACLPAHLRNEGF